MLPTRKDIVASEEVEKKSHTSEKYKPTCDFKRLEKINKDSERYTRYDRKNEEKIKKNSEALCS